MEVRPFARRVWFFRSTYLNALGRVPFQERVEEILRSSKLTVNRDQHEAVQITLNAFQGASYVVSVYARK